MTPEFLWAVAALFDMEGFESDHPLDPGGATILGFTKKWYPDIYAKLAAAPDMETQMQIARCGYYKEFWRPLRCAEIGDKWVAMELLEFGVNCPSAARAVREHVCSTLECKSLRECVEKWGSWPTQALFNAYQGYYYFTMRGSTFFAGWIKKRCLDWAPQRAREMVGK